ncbi:MAG: L-serine ammonia-lyase, iron-sulfur-dependent, subunit beta, partial [Actinomycetia bacterium]|nr:L-serine ammonia-lyase, iron-sulfur-dependent, subunit beta [Actinomycetes bacterium]
MPKVNSIFDIIGPVMVGPSSSHTAGAVRLGALARNIYGAQPQQATIGLHVSFRDTADGHGTKLALVAGLLGMGVDDIDIIHAQDIAREQGYAYTFESIELIDAHPNTAQFCLGSGD